MSESRKSSLCAAARPTSPEVTREQAMDAVRTLLRWAGDEPTREGLRDTPKRVVDAYTTGRQHFADARGDLCGEFFLHLHTVREGVDHAREFGNADDFSIRHVADMRAADDRCQMVLAE